jgi:hypothetical protein
MSSSTPSADPLGQLADEFVRRYRRGERPALTEYTAAHPDLADQILDLFPALVMLEDIRPEPQPAALAPRPEGPLQQLGDYRIVREVGRGGMGIVFEAEQESLGRRVALKVLSPGMVGEARQVERFQREARAAARLHHTNIVPVFAVGEEAGTHYYVMQYIEGRPLDDVLAELRRLRAEADRSRAPRAEREASKTEVPPGDGSRAGVPSSARVAQFLWQGPSRPASPPQGNAAAGGDKPAASGQAPGAPTPLPPAWVRRQEPTSPPTSLLTRSFPTPSGWRNSAFRWPMPWSTPRARGSCTATSSRPTCCWTSGGRSG